MDNKIHENFKLKPSQIKKITEGYDGCIASDMITLDGFPVIYMHRDILDNQKDSGWRFLSGMEDEAYMRNPNNHSVYDVNTIVNYVPTTFTMLDAPVGSEFEKHDENSQFNLINP